MSNSPFNQFDRPNIIKSSVGIIGWWRDLKPDTRTILKRFMLMNIVVYALTLLVTAPLVFSSSQHNLTNIFIMWFLLSIPGFFVMRVLSFIVTGCGEFATHTADSTSESTSSQANQNARDVQRSLDKLVQIETANYNDRMMGKFQGKR